ncbi:hypothetical protein [Wenjunlia tyrosinilytica]|jgi:hypothetical protein|uniref:Uncharacterized protein n=1 Tax=Wenjunlia tyrosinilytica TaxID=1544741 RepID=A0A917ZJ12_9ACTN|nr:hypothetical protein [Wenjunlia tyrosinilytica]GGO84399.1 hypothetical protein GCM10012280_15790 [Wenjunlia tyrosinilytica]
MARRYPGIALALPYEYSLAALPVATERADYGIGLLLGPPD